MIVDDTTVKPLEMNDGQPPTVTLRRQRRRRSRASAARLGAQLDISANEIPMVMSKLDALASGSRADGERDSLDGHDVTAAIRRSPRPPATSSTSRRPPPAGGDPRSPRAAFDSSPTLAGADDVAASGAGAPGPGNNDVALALAELRSNAVSLTSLAGTTTATLSDFFNETVGSARDRRRSRRRTKRPSSGRSRRTPTIAGESVSGVSTDEELIVDHRAPACLSGRGAARQRRRTT